MTKSTPSSFLPERFRILTGSSLKMIAMIFMFIDHFALYILNQIPECRVNLFTINESGYTIYRICRDAGRIAFPIFCFLLVEGFLHTRSKTKYAANLFLFACISEIPWNYAHSGTLYYAKQNVYFTLFFGFLGFCAIEYFHDKQILQLLSLLALLIVSYYFEADYGWKGYVFLLIMYTFRYYKPTQAIVGSCWLHYEWKACFAFLPINMYNGKRGFIRGKFLKYFFYTFYPVHILFLALLKKLLFA